MSAYVIGVISYCLKHGCYATRLSKTCPQCGPTSKMERDTFTLLTEAHMKNVEFTLNGQRAVVSFLSRYRDENDFEIYQAGKSGRIRQTDAGGIVSRSEHFTDADAQIAIAAHQAADAAEFARWQARNA